MDPRARFLAHVEDVRPALTAYVRSLLWNPSDLPDALQSTFLTAFEKLGSFQEGTNFRAWVFQIATHTVFNLNRRHARPAAAEPDLAEVFQTECSYEELIANPEVVLAHVDEEVRRAIVGLPELERASLLLVSVAEFTCREAASVLSIPIGSVMGYLARARGKLRGDLAKFARERGLIPEAP